MRMVLFSFIQAVVETTIGFIKEAPTLGVCGFNIYHKNRLIRVYQYFDNSLIWMYFGFVCGLTFNQ